MAGRETKLGAGNRGGTVCEMLILPDGRVLAHQITPACAALLNALNPQDRQLRPRCRAARRAAVRPHPPSP